MAHVAYPDHTRMTPTVPTFNQPDGTTTPPSAHTTIWGLSPVGILVRAGIPTLLVVAWWSTFGWRAGYMVQLDIAFGPHAPTPVWGFGLPVQWLIAVADHLVGHLAGSLYGLAIVLLCALAPAVALRKAPAAASLVASGIGVLNPYTYEHMVDGQWGVAAAAAMLILWYAAWELFSSTGRRRAAVALGSCSVLMMALSENFLGMLVILAALCVLSAVATGAPRITPRQISIGLACTFLPLLYGVIPFFLRHGGGSYATVRSFGIGDFLLFRATPRSGWLVPHLLGMYGYWGEATHRFPVGTNVSHGWIPATVILTGLTCLGAVVTARRRNLLVAGLFGTVVAGSTATAAGLAAAEALRARFPIIGVYRDPTKWTALWVIAVIVLTGEAIGWLLQRPHGPYREAGVIAIALAIAATLFPSGYTALRATPVILQPVSYPASWYSAAQYLSHHSTSGPMAILPWDLYVPLSFTHGRTVANPVGSFFSGPLVLPSNPQIPGDPVPASVGSIGHASVHPTGTCALSRALARARVHTVLVEAAPGGSAAVMRLVACGFSSIRYGSDTSGVTILTQTS